MYSAPGGNCGFEPPFLQKYNRPPICTNRGKLPCESTFPKLVVPSEIFGERKYGVLKVFSPSRRNCALTPSRIVKFLNNEMSQLASPGPRKGIVRLTLPNVSAGAVENAAGLIQLSMRWPMSPEVAVEMPVAFRR